MDDFKEDIMTDETLEEEFSEMKNEVLSSEKAMDKNTTELVYDLVPFLFHKKKELLGFELKNKKYVKTTHNRYTTKLVNSFISMISSVLTTHSYHSYLEKDDVRMILQQQNFAFENIVRNDHTLRDVADIKSILTQFDNTLQIFLFSLVDGKGAEGLRQAMGGVYQNLNTREEQRSKGIRFGYGNNELEIGGEK